MFRLDRPRVFKTATLVPTPQPPQQTHPEPRNLHPNRTPTTTNSTTNNNNTGTPSLTCLVHFKIARDARRLLEFAILVWTIPAQFVPPP